MTGWIDILSPTLRKLHADWLIFRGNFMMAQVGNFNTFAQIDTVTAVEPTSATVILPAQGPPIFKHVGGLLSQMLPGCQSGMSFTDLRSPLSRATATAPFLRVCTSRQPEARRFGRNTATEVNLDCEMLLLPFSDRKLRVCVIQAVYDLSGINWKKAFK